MADERLLFDLQRKVAQAARGFDAQLMPLWVLEEREAALLRLIVGAARSMAATGSYRAARLLLQRTVEEAPTTMSRLSVIDGLLAQEEGGEPMPREVYWREPRAPGS